MPSNPETRRPRAGAANRMPADQAGQAVHAPVRVEPASTADSPEQACFDREWDRVARLKTRLAALDALGETQQRAIRQRLFPVRQALHAAWREAVLCLADGLEALPLSRMQRVHAAAALCERAAWLVAAGQADAAHMAALHDTHAALAGVASLAKQRQVRQNHWAQREANWAQYRAANEARRERLLAKRVARAAWRAQQSHETALSTSVGQPAPEQASGQGQQDALRTLYRRLASALHPDREPDPALRQHKTHLMAEANTAYDRRDWPALVAIGQQAEQAGATAMALPAADRLPALTALLRQQAATLERERQAAQRRWRHALGLPDALALESDALARWLDRQDVLLQSELALAQQDAQDLNDARRFKSWLNKRLQSPNGPPPPGTGA